ncbi:MAG TPA: TonB-dependent receptor [Steroidobacteraceae bacterium]|nr:TonB-dependent receptor [Steroidobacteraceae bacterium]
MNPKYVSRASTLLLASVTAMPLAAYAADEAASEPDTIGEIVVTATKRDSTIQKVPFSIAALTDEKIRESGAMNLVDLAHNVAGLAIADLGPGQSQMAIRGISAGQVIRDQPGVKEQVGVYLDESPISVALFTPDMDLYDLNRFEVLRGPQGTLFGAGSTSGTVRYITNQPQLGAFSASAEIGASTVSHGSEGYSVKGMVNLPMGGIAAARLVGFYNYLPGWVDARQPDGSVEKDVNTGDRTGGRLSVLIQPTDSIRITPRIVYQKLSTDGYPRVDLWNILGNPTGPLQDQPADNFDDYEQYRQQREGIDDEFTLGDLKLEFDFGSVGLTSVSSYTDRKVTVLRDASQLTGSVTIDLGGTATDARLDSPLYDRTKLQVFSQEVRLASVGDHTVDWLVGGFYQDVDRKYGQQLPTPGYDAFLATVGIPPNTAFGAPADMPFYSNLSYKLQQYGAFGEATVHAGEKWAFTGGLRYYKFDEDRVLNFGGVFSDPTPPGGVPGTTSSDGVSPRLIVSFHPTDDIALNLQYAKGFRLGGINDPINVPLCSADDLLVFGNQGTWKDEKNENYEIGLKMRSDDRRYTFNISAFISDIDDLQATTTAGTCSSRIVFNVPKARSQGWEMEFFGRPTANWDFGISMSVVDAKLLSSVTSTNAAGDTVVVGGLAQDAQLPTASKLQGVASVGYTLPIMDGSKSIYTNLIWQHNGTSYSQFENEVAGFGQVGGAAGARLITLAPTAITSYSFDAQIPDLDVANLRIGFKADSWDAALYANNLFDERQALALDYERGRSARVGNIINQPRTIGVMFGMKF